MDETLQDGCTNDEALEAYARVVYAVAMRSGGSLSINRDEIPDECTVDITFSYTEDGGLEIKAERVTN